MMKLILKEYAITASFFTTATDCGTSWLIQVPALEEQAVRTDGSEQLWNGTLKAYVGLRRWLQLLKLLLSCIWSKRNRPHFG